MDTVKINDDQQLYYYREEQSRINMYLKRYAGTIADMKLKKSLSILDVGGGAGFFAKWIKGQIIEGGGKTACLKITVMDSSRYETWDGEDGINYVLCDAVNADQVFEKESFDYIFCNMFVHHLIGRTFGESEKIRDQVFVALKKILKPEGRIMITDNVNNGFLFNEASSRILFALTSCQNPIIKKVLFRFGAHSAGSGVCMMSLKMWNRLFMSAKLEIVEQKLTRPDKWNIVKKIFLMSKEYCEGVLFIVRKADMCTENRSAS